MEVLEKKSMKQFEAIKERNTTGALKLLSDKDILRDINVSFSRHQKQNYLCVACMYGNVDVVKKLLTIPGLDIDKGNPLSYAAYRNKSHIVKILLDAGVMVSESNLFAYGLALTPVHDAAFKGFTATVEVFLDKYPELINGTAASFTALCNSQVITPLYCAAFFGHMNTVQMLVERGADLNRTYAGKTAYDIAVINKRDQVAAYLKAMMETNKSEPENGDQLISLVELKNGEQLISRVEALEMQCNKQKTQIDDLKRDNTELKQQNEDLKLRVSKVETIVQPKSRTSLNNPIISEHKHMVDCVRQNYELLINNLLVEDHLDFLYQEYALSLDDCQIIETERSDKRKTKAMLQRLLRQKSCNWVTVFKKSLERCSQTEHLVVIFN